MVSQRDFYEVLKVSRESSADEIRKAYKKLALANHPDRNPGDEAAIERFKEAAEAFDVLSNPDKRARYDRYGHAGLAGGGGGTGFADVGDIFDAFGDLFGDFFGGSSGRTSRSRRGSSLRAGVRIDLTEAATGCDRNLEVRRRELCETCGGSGARTGTSPVHCDYCGGRGQVVQAQGFFRIQTTCPACRGSGTVVRDKCTDCGGDGRVGQTTRLEVKIPPGVDSGMQLCLRGEGESGAGNNSRGDLYVDIEVRPHALFERHGRDLLCRVPVTYCQATLGTRIPLPLLNGRHELVIDPGTQPGEVIRLRGRGMPDAQGGRTGDLHVEVQVEVPTKLSEREEELLRELAELEDANVSLHRKSFFEKIREIFVPDDE